GRGADDLAADEQVDARLAGVLAAADEEVEVVALDLELGRSERADGGVAAAEAVDEPLAEEAGDRHLARQRALRRPGAEGSAGGGPAGGVGVALEVGEEEVGTIGGAKDEAGQGEQGEEENGAGHGNSGCT